MRLIRLGAAAALLLTCASCARQATPGGEPQPGTVSATAARPDPSNLPLAMRPNLTVPDPRAVGLAPTPWARSAPAGGRELRIEYAIGGRVDCATLGRVEVTETSREVTVTLLVGRLPGADCAGPQPGLAAVMSTMVTLKAPLGARTVRDGARS